MPLFLVTKKVWPSWNVVGPKTKPEPSREAVQVVLRMTTSTNLLRTAVNRSLGPSLVVTGMYSTLLASPSTAAAITRQKSTSKPVQRLRTAS